MTGHIVQSVLAARIPRMAIEEEAPPFMTDPAAGMHRPGEAVRATAPEVPAIRSAHRPTAFNRYAACRALHEGVCGAGICPAKQKTVDLSRFLS